MYKMGHISLPLFLTLIQVAFIVLFGVFVRYPPDPQPYMVANRLIGNFKLNVNGTVYESTCPGCYVKENKEVKLEGVSYAGLYSLGGILFVGFGFLMTFLKRYGYSSLTFNLVIAALSIQWAILCNGWLLNFKDNTIILSIKTLIESEYATMAVLVSFGAVLGKLNLLQIAVMALVEVVLFHCNLLVCHTYFKVTDTGFSILVHVFGAYFGLMVALFTARPGDVQAQSYKELSVYHSDMLTMIGTLFMFLFWPFANAALVNESLFFRAVANTYVGLLTSVVAVLIMSTLVQKNRRLTMIHVQNATLAGGVVMGAVVDLILTPYVAMILGFVAGVFSVLGYQYLTPCFNQRLKIHDTRGIHNLHGLPGIISAIASIVIIAADLNSLPKDTREGRDALYQLASVAVVVGIAIVGGIITGFLLRIPIWKQPKDAEIMDDWDYWVLPSDGYPLIPNTVNAPPIYKLPEQAAMIGA